MARELSGKPNVDAPDSDYPFGRIRDNSGIGDGTPVDEEVYGDFHQFFAKLMDVSLIPYNNLPDNEYSGFQYFEALLNVISLRVGKRVEGSIDLDDQNYAGIYDIVDTDTNIPSGLSPSGGQLIISGVIDGDLTQRVVDYGHSAEWIRTTNDGGASWSAWTLIRLAEKVVEIGIWDMDTDSVKLVDHEIADAQKIRDVSVLITNDANDLITPINAIDASGMQGGIQAIGPTQINLTRITGESFDSVSYNDNTINRGWCTLQYDPS